MKSFEDLIKNTKMLEDKIGYRFHDKQILYQALVHKSYANEWPEKTDFHNERLELLGDAVLGLIIVDILFNRFKDFSEGKLSILKATLVDAPACANYMLMLGINEYILLGRGEYQSSGMQKENIMADGFEALVAAIYLDGGLEKAKAFILKNFSETIEKSIASPRQNYKANLQDFCQKNRHPTPSYSVVDEMGPDHAKTFIVKVTVAKIVQAEGQGSSKKDAEQEAAKNALKKIEEDL